MIAAALVQRRDKLDVLIRRWVPALALAGLAAVLLVQAVVSVRSALVLVGYPFGVDYGEGIVWQQMLNLLRGQGYAPLGTYPAIVYHYPPLFHLVTAAVAALSGLDGLAAGRLVSGSATLGIAAAIGRLAWDGRPVDDPVARLATAMLAGLVFLGTGPVMQWGAVMRVDMLAGLLGLWGLVAAVGAVRRPGLVWWAALLFAAALFTKQVSIAAPVAAWLGLLATKPGRAWSLAAATAAIGLAGLATMSWLTGGGFLTHILLYNINRFNPQLLWALVEPLRAHAVYLVLAGAGAWRLLCRIVRDRRDLAADPTGSAAAIAITSFLLVKTAMLAMVMKSGASSNYLVEWLAAVALTAAFALGPAVAAALPGVEDRNKRPSALFATCLLSVTAVQAFGLWRPGLTPADAVAPARTKWQLVDAVRHNRAPVISDEMTVLIRAGRPVEWEPAIAAELGATGRYDQAGFIRLVRAHRFGMFLTEGGPGLPDFDSRYTPPVLAAIQASYPVTRTIGVYVLRRPRPHD